MSTILPTELGTRVLVWLDALAATRARVRASELYCGSGWVPVKRILERGSVNVWIVSAGYGLLRPDMPVAGYSATFTSAVPDSVVPENATFGVADWWQTFSRSTPANGNLRCIADIAEAFPRTPLVAALSNEYLTATYGDLRAAAECLQDRDRFIIIAAGANKSGALADHFLPCDSRMEHVVGRGRSSLNVRVLDSVLSEFGTDLRASALRGIFARRLSKLPSADYPKREKSGDADVLAFIKSAHHANPRATHSNLLRAYRATGRACEQSRFRELFRSLSSA